MAKEVDHFFLTTSSAETQKSDSLTVPMVELA